MRSEQLHRGIVVVHIVPFDQPRGAQRYARSLVEHLNREDETHLVLTMFAADSDVLEADVRLDVPRGVWRRAGADPRVLWRLRRAAMRIEPDVVVAHGGESAKYAALALPRAIPLIYLKIGAEHPGLDRRASAWLHRFYTGRADAVVAVSEMVADEIRQREGLASGDVVVIPNGRDPEVYRPADGGQGSPGRDRLIWIGQLDETKRPEWFVDLVGSLRERGHDVEALMLGDGPRREEIERAGRAVDLQVLGRRDDVPELLAGARLLVFTGMPPEGMPGVLIEAGLCGVPVVSTRVPGAADVVEDGVTGILVDVDDRAGMISQVERLLGDESTRVAMGAAGRRRCVELFSMEASALRWRETIGRLLAGSSSGKG